MVKSTYSCRQQPALPLKVHGHWVQPAQVPGDLFSGWIHWILPISQTFIWSWLISRLPSHFSAWCKPWTCPRPHCSFSSKGFSLLRSPTCSSLLCTFQLSPWHSLRLVSSCKIWSCGPGDYTGSFPVSPTLSQLCTRGRPVHLWTPAHIPSLSLRVSYSVVPSLEQFLFLSLCSLLTENIL